MKMTTGESEKVIERAKEREILIRCYRVHVNNQWVLFDEMKLIENV